MKIKKIERKDKKLKNIIISEEYKFWKFISGRKFLNENIYLKFQHKLLLMKINFTFLTQKNLLYSRDLQVL